MNSIEAVETKLANLTPEERERIVAQIAQDRERRHHYMHNYNRQYYAEHTEETALRGRQYRKEHAEERASYHAQRNEALKEEISEYGRQYYQEHREKILEYRCRYIKEHPETHRRAKMKRRALEAGSSGDFTPEEFRLLCEVYENRCAYCHKELPLTPDHAIPLSKGGSNDIENIVPACAPCNQRKHTMTYDEYVKRLAQE